MILCVLQLYPTKIILFLSSLKILSKYNDIITPMIRLRESLSKVAIKGDLFPRCSTLLSTHSSIKENFTIHTSMADFRPLQHVRGTEIGETNVKSENARPQICHYVIVRKSINLFMEALHRFG